MHPSRLLWLGILIGVLGALAGIALSSPQTDASAPDPFPPTGVTGGGEAISPDPRWLDLVRARAASGVRLQSATPSLHVHLTDRTVAGRVPSPAPVSIRVVRGEAQVAAATAIPFPDGGGYLYFATLTWNSYPGGCGGVGGCGCGALEPGDVVWVAQGSAGISLTVPPLTARADGAAGAVSGTAPPSETVALYLYPRRDPSAVLTQTVAAGPDGAYQASWADLRPGDSGLVAWNADADRAAYVRFVAPFLQVQVNGWEIVGAAAPCSNVWITVTDRVGNFLSNRWAFADAQGAFFAWSGEYEKELFPAQSPGHRVEASAAGQVFSTTVLPVAAWTDRTGGQVLGEALAGAPVRVEVAHGPLEGDWESVLHRLPYASVTVTATAGGRYTATLPLRPADIGAAFTLGPDGHETFARFAVPYLRVILGPDSFWYGYRLQGQVDGANVPITLTLQGPAGLIQDVRLLRSAGNGFFRDLSSPNDPVLETGDVLTVETARGVQAALTLPVLTARVAPLSDTVSGEAPPGARLTVTVSAGAYGASSSGGPSPNAAGPRGGGEPTPPPYPLPVLVSQVVTAGADGTYVADFRGIADLTRRTAGEVSLTTPEGHTVLRLFRAQDCRPVLTAVAVGGNYLSGVSSQGCPSLTLRLIGPDGAVKAVGYADFSWWDSFWFYFYMHTACPWPDGCDSKDVPILILPGDRIEITSGGAVYTTTVPTLTLEVDRETPALSGWAPAGETLRAEIRDDFAVLRHVLSPTVTPQGRYTVSLAGIYTPTAGDSFTVWWQSGETGFYALDVLPRLEAGLFGSSLFGLLHPLIPYTVTPGVVTGYAGPGGEWFASVGPLFPGDTVTVTTPREELPLTLPLLTARIDRSAGTVSGQAPPDGLLEVSLVAYPLYRSQWVTATAAGTYTVSFPEMAAAGGAWGTVRYINPQGHRVFLQFGTCSWSVSLGEPCASGYADMAGAPFTATLATSGGFPEIVTGTASRSNASFSACFSRPIGPGDRLRLAQASGETEFVVPRLTATHDWVAQVLEGEAPPGSLVEVTFLRGWQSVRRRTVADSTGHYRLDTRGLYLQVGQPGTVALTDGEGNRVQLDFVVRGYSVYLPVVLR